MGIHVVHRMAKVVGAIRMGRSGRGRLVTVNGGFGVQRRRWRHVHFGVAHDRGTESVRSLIRTTLCLVVVRGGVVVHCALTATGVLLLNLR